MVIQMSAKRLGDQIGLVFTTVMDQMSLGLVDEDEEIQEPADRVYWENRGSKKTVALADQLLEIARQFDPLLELKYNKFYIGLAKYGQPNNFIIFRPKKGFIRFEPRLQNSPTIKEGLENAGLDVMGHDNRWGRYRIRLQSWDLEKNKEILTEVVKEAFEASSVE